MTTRMTFHYHMKILQHVTKWQFFAVNEHDSYCYSSSFTGGGCHDY